MPYDAASPPPPPHAVVRDAGTLSVTVPEVATTASDGWPAVMHPGNRRWSVPVLLNASASERIAWLEVNGSSCPNDLLPPGVVVRLSCTSLVKPHSTVTVTLNTPDGVVATWVHTVR